MAVHTIKSYLQSLLKRVDHTTILMIDGKDIQLTDVHSDFVMGLHVHHMPGRGYLVSHGGDAKPELFLLANIGHIAVRQ